MTRLCQLLILLSAVQIFGGVSGFSILQTSLEKHATAILKLRYQEYRNGDQLDFLTETIIPQIGQPGRQHSMLVDFASDKIFINQQFFEYSSSSKIVHQNSDGVRYYTDELVLHHTAFMVDMYPTSSQQGKFGMGKNSPIWKELQTATFCPRLYEVVFQPTLHEACFVNHHAHKHMTHRITLACPEHHYCPTTMEVGYANDKSPTLHDALLVPQSWRIGIPPDMSLEDATNITSVIMAQGNTSLKFDILKHHKTSLGVEPVSVYYSKSGKLEVGASLLTIAIHINPTKQQWTVGHGYSRDYTTYMHWSTTILTSIIPGMFMVYWTLGKHKSRFLPHTYIPEIMGSLYSVLIIIIFNTRKTIIDDLEYLTRGIFTTAMLKNIHMMSIVAAVLCGILHLWILIMTDKEYRRVRSFLYDTVLLLASACGIMVTGSERLTLLVGLVVGSYIQYQRSVDVIVHWTPMLTHRGRMKWQPSEIYAGVLYLVGYLFTSYMIICTSYLIFFLESLGPHFPMYLASLVYSELLFYKATQTVYGL